MNTSQARTMFEAFAPAVAYVEVEKSNGDIGLGSSFHVGEGVFVTARHVVEGARILDVATTQSWYRELDDDEKRGLSTASGSRLVTTIATPTSATKVYGPYLHPNPSVDVAAFVAEGIVAPIVPLGDHLDDWLGTELVLTSAVVLGYPPIPLSRKPVLVAARAEINAIVDMYTGGHPHFVISTMARGGFSGGLALSEFGFALGVITQSLVRDGLPTEHGFFSVLSVEPIYVCLAEHRLLPRVQREHWDGHWYSDTIWYGTPDNPNRISASVDVVSDPDIPRVVIAVNNDDYVFGLVLQAAASFMDAVHGTVKQIGLRMAEIECAVPSPDKSEEYLAVVRAAGSAAAAVLDGRGYVRTFHKDRDPWIPKPTE